MENDNLEKRGPFIPKEDIGFFYPVHKKYTDGIETYRTNARRKGERPLAPYQFIEEAIQDALRRRGIEQ